MNTMHTMQTERSPLAMPHCRVETQHVLREPASLHAAAGSARLSVFGSHAGVGPRSSRRRGSFLVLVVGTLALIAIITIVFVALGSQDSRTRSAVESREKFDAVPPQMVDYISGIVARDAVATRTDIITNVGNDGVVPAPKQLIRETTDAPGTRYDVVAIPSGTGYGPAHVFNPEGTAPSGVEPLDFLAGVPASDPWLAASKPTAYEPVVTPLEERLKTPDWAAITNIAPDGIPVNLVNLRNPANGLFGVTSREMREGTVPANAITSTNDYLDLSRTDLVNRPAAFSMRQLGAFRPAAVGPGTDWSDPQMKLNSWADADGDGWLDSRWFEMRKQVADNGDAGDFLDVLALNDRRTRYVFAARIIDLSGRVNVHTATDLMAGPSENFPLGLTPADVDLRRLLTGVDVQDDGAGTRLTFSNLAAPWPAGPQVSTLVGPDVQGFVGSRAYIALRASVMTGSPLPREFAGVRLTDAPADTVFSPGDPIWLFNEDGRLVQPGSVEERFGFVPALDSPYTLPLPAATGQEWRTFFAYAPGVAGGNPAITTPALRNTLLAGIDAAGRGRLNAYAKALGYSQGTVLATAPDLPFGGAVRETAGSNLPFGVPDLAELLEREGVNSDRTSALESVLSGRTTDFEAIDPLRSTRPTSDELRVADFSATAPIDEGFPDAWLLRALDVRSSITTLSGARQIRPWRPQISTPDNPLSSAMQSAEAKIDLVAQLSNRLYEDDVALTDLFGPDVPSPAGAATSPDFYLARPLDPAVYRIFDGYAEALAPFSRFNGSGPLPNAWGYTSGSGAPGSFATSANLADGSADVLNTLFYGYRGPELALQIAAHMSVNLVDMVDGDSQPTVATLEMVQNYVENNSILPTGTPDNGTIATDPPATITTYPAPENLEVSDLLPGLHALDQRAGGTGLDPSEVRPDATLAGTPDVRIARQRLSRTDDERLAVNVGDTVNPVINVYGIEPQVFLTQVASVTTYWDSDTGATPNDVGDEVHIDGAIAADNEELLFRATIFQISNPFDRPVRLSSAPYSEAMRAVPSAGGYGGPAWINDPLRHFDGTSNIANPGAYVPVHDLVARGYDASRLGSFYYVDVGDTSTPTPDGRGKRFALVSLREQTYTASAPTNAVQPVDASLVGQFARIGPAGTEPAIVTMDEIVVPAGGTVTCVALSKPPSEIYRLISDPSRDPSFGAPTGSAGAPDGDARERVLRLLARHFSPRTDPTSGLFDPSTTHWIPQIDPVTSDFLGFTDPAVAEFVDPVVTPPATPLPTPTNVQYATLWRTVRGALERQGDGDPDAAVFNGAFPAATEFLSTDGGTSRDTIVSVNDDPGALQLIRPNNFENDQMVDRMKIVSSGGTTIDLNLRLPDRVGGVTVTNAFTTLPSSPPPGAELVADDSLTLTLAAWVRRPTQNPDFVTAIQDATGRLPAGMLPAWAIEPKYFPRDLPWNAAFRTSLSNTIAASVTPAAGDLLVTQFETSASATFTGATRAIEDWRRQMDGTPVTGGAESPLFDVTGTPAARVPLANALFGENWAGNTDTVDVPSFAGAVSVLAPALLSDEIDDRPPGAGFLGVRESSLNQVALPPNAISGPERLDLLELGSAVGDARLQLFFSQRNTLRETLSVMRLTDLLLPAGIGPMSAPFDRDTGTVRSHNYSVGEPQLEQFLARHTTLGEAVAEVLGYSKASVSEAALPDGYAAGTTDISTWLNPASGGADFSLPDTDGLTRNDETLFDGIHLALDRFLPFVDLDNDRERDVGGSEEPGALNDSPLALGVLDQFVITPPPLPALPVDPSVGGLPASPDLPTRPSVTSLVRSQPGLININTASVEVLRTLPGVAPTFDNTITGSIINEYEWTKFERDFAFTNPAAPGAGTPRQFGSETDIAPSLVAYRELGSGVIRERTWQTSAWQGFYAGPYTDPSINPSGASDQSVRMIALPQDLRDTPDAILNASLVGAQRQNGIQLFEGSQTPSMAERGLFQGVGDVLNARLRQPSAPELRGLPVNPDYLAFNTNVTIGAGLDPQESSLAKLSPFRATRSTDDGVPNGYDEKLSIVAQFANTITTRSDTFAAWFVVHGYREEDVTNLAPTQAMVPSVKRRFLMVIDRSEVTRLGQKPNVLLLQEVPYEFPARQ
jgi:hypothetical protein